MNLVDLRLGLLTVPVFCLCRELQSTIPVRQSALDGRLICIACGSIRNWFAKFWYAVHLEFWETVVVFLLPALHVET